MAPRDGAAPARARRVDFAHLPLAARAPTRYARPRPRQRQSRAVRGRLGFELRRRTACAWWHLLLALHSRRSHPDEKALGPSLDGAIGGSDETTSRPLGDRARAAPRQRARPCRLAGPGPQRPDCPARALNRRISLCLHRRRPPKARHRFARHAVVHDRIQRRTAEPVNDFETLAS